MMMMMHAFRHYNLAIVSDDILHQIRSLTRGLTVCFHSHWIFIFIFNSPWMV